MPYKRSTPDKIDGYISMVDLKTEMNTTPKPIADKLGIKPMLVPYGLKAFKHYYTIAQAITIVKRVQQNKYCYNNSRKQALAMLLKELEDML